MPHVTNYRKALTARSTNKGVSEGPIGRQLEKHGTGGVAYANLG